jgi:hypothetical protein
MTQRKTYQGIVEVIPELLPNIPSHIRGRKAVNDRKDSVTSLGKATIPSKQARATRVRGKGEWRVRH